MCLIFKQVQNIKHFDTVMNTSILSLFNFLKTNYIMKPRVFSLFFLFSQLNNVKLFDTVARKGMKLADITI